LRTYKFKHTAAKIIVFGSYVNGTEHEGSDIDIAVISEDFAQMNLRERLELLGLAAGRIMEPIEALGYTVEEVKVLEKLLLIHTLFLLSGRTPMISYSPFTRLLNLLASSSSFSVSGSPAAAGTTSLMITGLFASASGMFSKRKEIMKIRRSEMAEDMVFILIIMLSKIAVTVCR
jgi:hypothetical protein